MAQYSTQGSSTLSSGPVKSNRSQRPGITRVYHTWHGQTMGLSHFEDFMLEIGADPKAVHLCCVPRQGTTPRRHSHTSSETKSQKKIIHGENTSSEHKVSQADRGRSLMKTYDPRSVRGLEAKSEPHKQTLAPSRPKRHTLTSPFAPLSASAQQLKALPSSSVLANSSSGLFAGPASLSNVRDALLAISQSYSISQPPYHGPGFSENTWTSDAAPQPDVQIVSSEPIPTTSSASTLTVRSRTSSTVSLATASSSEGPETPRAHSPLMSPSQELRRSLSDLEHTSRFRAPTSCVTCKRSGSNYPCCPKCGDVWCSRHCRMAAGKDGKHSCHCRMVEPAIVYA